MGTRSKAQRAGMVRNKNGTIKRFTGGAFGQKQHPQPGPKLPANAEVVMRQMMSEAKNQFIKVGPKGG